MNGTVLAHTDGNVPNLMVRIPRQDAYSLGQLFYFFEFACGISGYLLGVNPFNQPGVESYKKNMFALLGKPGYEEQRAHIFRRKIYRYLITISLKLSTKSEIASSLVTQEVQNRRQVWSGSGLHWKVVRYLLLISSASSLGKMGKI